MKHSDFDPFDYRRCRVVFVDGSVKEGQLVVFDLTGGYRNILIYDSGDEAIPTSFEPEEAFSVCELLRQ